MASPRLRRLPRNAPGTTPEGDALAAELEAMFATLTENELHEMIVRAVPEMGRLPGNVHLVRKARKAP